MFKVEMTQMSLPTAQTGLPRRGECDSEVRLTLAVKLVHTKKRQRKLCYKAFKRSVGISSSLSLSPTFHLFKLTNGAPLYYLSGFQGHNPGTCDMKWDAAHRSSILALSVAHTVEAKME